jgi:16S rRNA (guanine(966)-N(2))-methyltransferase RsmD
VRIIGGQWKRTPLPVLDAEGLRPTPDRVRETVFNWITHLIDGAWEQVACLDLFAGSGALGFEAASRGARRVVMVENSGPAVRQLEANRDKLKADKLAIVRGDALAAVQSAAQREPGGYGLVFIDPPITRAGWKKCCRRACLCSPLPGWSMRKLNIRSMASRPPNGCRTGKWSAPTRPAWSSIIYCNAKRHPN